MATSAYTVASVRDSHRAMITILRVAYSFSFCCRRPHRIQARRQEIKLGVLFVKNVENGDVFCKKVDDAASVCWSRP